MNKTFGSVRKKLLGLYLGIVALLAMNGTVQASELKIRLEPNVVIIGATYNGTTVKVTGEVPVNSEAVIYVTGQRKDTEFKKKGKAFRVLWMNLGTVVFHNVPNLYLIFTGPDTKVDALPVGFEALKEKISITPTSENKNSLFREFIKLKTKEGFYSITKGALKYDKRLEGMKPFTCTITLPSKLVPGNYEVHLVAINSGKVIASTREILKAEEKGLPNLVASLAFRHSTTYGILATVIAIIAGLLMGIIFKGGKGGH